MLPVSMAYRVSRPWPAFFRECPRNSRTSKTFLINTDAFRALGRNSWALEGIARKKKTLNKVGRRSHVLMYQSESRRFCLGDESVRKIVKKSHIERTCNERGTRHYALRQNSGEWARILYLLKSRRHEVALDVFI